MKRDLPFVCPACYALVRHNWVDTCGVCNAPLFEDEPQSEAVLTTQIPDLYDTDVTTVSTLDKLKSEFNKNKKKILIGGGGVAAVLALLTGTALTLSSSGSAPVDIAEVTTTTAKPGQTSTEIEDIAHKATVGASDGFFSTAYPPLTDVSQAGLMQARWITTTDAICHCSVDFPWTPTITNEAGAYSLLSSSPNSEFDFGLVSTDEFIGKKASDSDLKAFASAIASASKTKVESQSLKNNLGVRQLDAKLTGDGGSGLIRVFQGGNGTLYVLVVGSVGQDDSATLFEKFASSFAIQAST